MIIWHWIKINRLYILINYKLTKLSMINFNNKFVFWFQVNTETSGCLKANGHLCLGLLIVIIMCFMFSYNCQDILYLLISSVIYTLLKSNHCKANAIQLHVRKPYNSNFNISTIEEKNSDNNFHRDTRKNKCKITRHRFKKWVLSRLDYFFTRLYYHNCKWSYGLMTLRLLVRFCDISTVYIFSKLKCSILYVLPSYPTLFTNN